VNTDKCERCTTEALAIFLIALSLFTITVLSVANFTRKHFPQAPRVQQICYVYTDGRPTDCRPEEA